MIKFLRLFQNLPSVFFIVSKRLRHYWNLSISAEAGIISVLSLVICVPIFTNSVMSRVFKQELTEKSIKYHRRLFSIHAYYMDDALYTPLTYENARYVSQWLDTNFSRSIGLKVKGVYLEATTKTLTWKPVKFAASKPPFVDIQLGLMTNNIVPQKTELVEGVWPAYNPAEKTIPDPLPVAVYEGFADDKFINVGDIYQMDNPKLRIKVVGIFRAIDPNDLDWFYIPDTTFNKGVWIPLEFFQVYLPTILDRPINYSSWYAIVDEQSIRFNNSVHYSHAMVRLSTTLTGILPNIKIDYSPLDQLKAYESRMRSLVIFFYIVGAPIIMLSLIFISLTSSISVHQLEQETVTMRGRGASLQLVFLQNFIESLILILVATPFSIFFGWLSAILIGQTRSFLQFTSNSDFTYSLMDINWVWFGMLSLFIMVARLLPLLNLKNTTVVKVKQERSRATKPIWQRFYLDFLLLIPAGYTYWRLRHQLNQLKLLAGQNPNRAQGQYDPLQFVASSIFVIAACMVALRIFPIITRFLRTIIDRGFPVGPFLAIQEISRLPQEHNDVMLLIMISLSIAIFSTSIAKTLNQWVYDSQYYQTGADLVIKEYEIPKNTGSPTNGDSLTQPINPTVVNGVESLIGLEKHLQIPGIQSATFVGKYSGTFTYGSGRNDCILMGIDRLSFPNTAYYRHDFTNLSLGELMNSLAEQPNGVLVPQNLLESTGLQLGDHIRASAPIGLYKQGFDEDMIIVGTYEYFPTVYPEEIPTLIVNTESLFGYPEAATGYDVWLNIQKKSNAQAMIIKLKSLALSDQLVVDVRGNALQQIQNLTSQPEWLGLFGILSVGFILTGLLSYIGFILDSFASLRKNFIQLGILQAIGLSTSQMIIYLLLERLLLIGVALACGAGIGFLTSILFVPLLQMSIAPGAPVPPFLVLIGWTEAFGLVLSFGVIFVIAITGTIGYMVRIKIFQAVKMGESI